MLRPQEIDLVKGVVEAYRSHSLDAQRDSQRIAHAVSIVRANTDNPRLCSHAEPTELGQGDAVCFLYGHPDVNEPWRFGIVDSFNAGCWIIFTLNIKRRREKAEKIVKAGPSFRQYDLRKMTRVRRVCRPGTDIRPLPAADDLATLGRNVRDLVNAVFPPKS